jgi:predicted GH43/DUF377 family glycosyl hydrolase
MEPEKGNDQEVEGVLNPGAVRGKDGALYLFPRLVAKGNYSRIGIARVIFNKDNNPIDVERLGIALEPQESYEMRPDGGGCEDARVTYIEPLKRYIMTYTAFSSEGPRVALAESEDLMKWERLGLATYTPYEHVEFNGIDNKDAVVFPITVPSPNNYASIAMLHRPLFPGTSPEETVHLPIDREIRKHHECIWISYSHVQTKIDSHHHLPKFVSHHPLAVPSAPWERLKIGAGTPPMLTKHGWLILYHGVTNSKTSTRKAQQLIYSAGVMVLDKRNPLNIVYRSLKPILTPDLQEEQVGTVAKVVFPTGIDRRDDIGEPNRFDVYYGIADNCIGVARMDIPDKLPM